MKPIHLAFVVLLVAPSASLVPFAAAHVSDFSQSRAIVAGPYNVFFEPRPTPPFAENTVSMVVQVSSVDTGALIPRIPASVLVASGDFTERKKMEGDGTGYLVASMVLPAAGNFSVRVFVTDESSNQTYAADTEFEVFPNIPYRIRAVDQTVDVYTGQRTPLAFEVVDPVSLEAKDVGALQVRLEHWTEDHKTFLSAQDAPATKQGAGVWRIDPVFQETGMYHVRFASDAGGFNYADVPMLHVYAVAPSEGALQKDTPGPQLGLLVAIVLVLATLTRRR